MFDSFRGFDLSKRKQRIARAMNLVPPETADDIPVIAHTPCYFGFGCERMPDAYWQDPAVMLAWQQDGYERHLKQVDDDAVPYFMPWFGTGVLASAFGCPMREATGHGDDPAVIGTAIDDPAQIARLKKPAPYRDGWMPRVIRFMEYGARHGEMPVGLSDLNSPLCTAAQIVGYDNLFYWMYDEENAVDDLMALLTESFIDWVRLQKQISGEDMYMSNGLQGVWTPRGGVWLSDDDLVSVGPELYARFVLPHYQRIFKEFGGGHLHYCGVGSHQLENILAIPSLTAVNNSAMGNADAFAKLVGAASGKLAIEIQDVAPVTPDSYYEKIFAGVDDFTGIMVATFVEDTLGMDDAGRTVAVNRSAVENANAVVRAVRAAAAKRMRKEK